MTKTPPCPYCGERELVEDDSRIGFCAVCGKIWHLDNPPRPARPAASGQKDPP